MSLIHFMFAVLQCCLGIVLIYSAFTQNNRRAALSALCLIVGMVAFLMGASEFVK
jgi:uncharacterized membrane protein HdeD (DUF308 family)